MKRNLIKLVGVMALLATASLAHATDVDPLVAIQTAATSGNTAFQAFVPISLTAFTLGIVFFYARKAKR